MAVERPSQPEGFGAAVARTEPKTVPAANAPAAARRKFWRENSPAIVGLPRLRHDPHCRLVESRCRMTCRGATGPCPNRYRPRLTRPRLVFWPPALFREVPTCTHHQPRSSTDCVSRQRLYTTTHAGQIR